jgi:hypothetical protein
VLTSITSRTVRFLGYVLTVTPKILILIGVLVDRKLSHAQYARPWPIHASQFLNMRLGSKPALMESMWCRMCQKPELLLDDAHGCSLQGSLVVSTLIGRLFYCRYPVWVKVFHQGGSVCYTASAALPQNDPHLFAPSLLAFFTS